MKVCTKILYILNLNIVLLYREEEIKQIIKIQSNVRGMEMREKIKLKSKNKNRNILQKKDTLPKINEFNYENNIIKETEENDSEKYEKILVNQKYIL